MHTVHTTADWEHSLSGHQTQKQTKKILGKKKSNKPGHAVNGHKLVIVFFMIIIIPVRV